MIVRIATIVIAASLAACGPDTPSRPTPIADTPSTPAPPAVPARVNGVVLDFQSAKPLAGAVVGFATDFFLQPTGITETAVTDANGRYSLPEPPPRANGGRYVFVVNNQNVGSGYPRAANARGGDVAVDQGKCIARYGLVLDSRTFAPIAGATARSLTNALRATSDQNGWYHIDWGCGIGFAGFNTTWHVMSHPDYNSSNFASGRGISGNFREDVLLTPR